MATGQFGLLASVAALSPESDDWLDGLLVTLDANRRLLGDLLAAQLPEARYRMPDAGYLGWIDLAGLGWGDELRQADPARGGVSPCTSPRLRGGRGPVTCA